jgi:hypothetical protein
MSSFPIQFAPAFAAAAPRGLSARLRGWRAGERWAGYLALLVAMAGVRTPLGAAAALGIGLLLLWVADRSRRQWARVGWLMPMLILFVAVGGLDLGGGARGIGIFGISFSAAGLEAGAVLAARCLALAMTGMSLVAICPPHAVLRDALPGWMPARARTLVWLTERAVHRVGREAVALRQAARARGFALTLHPRDLRTAARLAGDISRGACAARIGSTRPCSFAAFGGRHVVCRRRPAKRWTCSFWPCSGRWRPSCWLRVGRRNGFRN